MSGRIEVHRPPEAETPGVEILKKRDAELVKYAISRLAADSMKAKAVKDSLAHQDVKHGVEIEKQQLETVQKALGKLATEKGITKFPQRFRSRRLARKLGYARQELN